MRSLKDHSSSSMISRAREWRRFTADWVSIPRNTSFDGRNLCASKESSNVFWVQKDLREASLPLPTLISHDVAGKEMRTPAFFRFTMGPVAKSSQSWTNYSGSDWV